MSYANVGSIQINLELNVINQSATSKTSIITFQNNHYFLLSKSHYLSKQSLSLIGLPSSDPLRVPSLMVGRVTNSAVEYQVQRNDAITKALITGYEVFRFGVPMIGEYVHAGRGRRVTISRAVPGAQYRITAWALGHGRRSATPAVVYVTTGEASECGICTVCV